MLWAARLKQDLVILEPPEEENIIQMESVESIKDTPRVPPSVENTIQMEPVESINDPPPAYSDHEFLFQDDLGEEENGPSPGYTVPFIDPPAYGNPNIVSPEPPPG